MRIKKTIDPQKLQAIKEGRVINTEGIKTTFVPTSQQLDILQAMERQKLNEQKQGKSDYQLQREGVERAKAKLLADKQRTEDFRNRTTEEILNNFIKTQLDIERTQNTGTNFTKAVTTSGYNPNKPETIPTTIFQSSRLDTEEKMRSSGLATNIIALRLGIPTPQDLDKAKSTIDTSVKTFQRVITTQPANYTGLTEPERHYQNQETRFVPQIQHQATKPVGITAVGTPNSVTTQGLSLQSYKPTSSSILPMVLGVLFLA